MRIEQFRQIYDECKFFVKKEFKNFVLLFKIISFAPKILAKFLLDILLFLKASLCCSLYAINIDNKGEIIVMKKL